MADPSSQTLPLLPRRFLRASFHPPASRISLIKRQRLLAWLDEAGARARVLLVVAPAGCGKTTLLSQWLENGPAGRAKRAWLNITRDAGAADFLLSICWALQLADIDLGETGLLSESSEVATDCEERLAVLLSAIAQHNESLVLILDEFEHLRDRESLALVELLAAACPPNLQIVIASRRRPALALSLLVTQGLVAHLAAEELVFSQDETRSLLHESVPAEDAELIMRKTEGWPVAVTLAKLWRTQSGPRLSGLREFSGTTDEVSAYLAEQVLAGLTPRLREFLLDVSVLDQVSAAMADAVRGTGGAAELLHELVALDPLVTLLDPTHTVVHLHPLLTEHLNDTLRVHDPQRFKARHERAAIEYSRTGRVLDAVRHALAAGNPKLACTLLLSHSPIRVCVMHGSAEMSACLRLLPEEAKRAHPRLRLCEIFLWVRRGEHTRAAQEFRVLTAERADPSVHYLLESFAIEVLFAFRNPGFAEQKLEELRAAYRACGRIEAWTEMVIETLALIVHRRAGNLEAARRSGELQLAAYAGSDPSGSSLHTALHLNHTLLAEGRLSEAEVGLRKVLRMSRSVVGPERSISVITRSFLSYIHYESDRDELTESELDNLLNDLERTDAWFDHYAIAYTVAIEALYRAAGTAHAARAISKGRLCALRQELGDSFSFLLRTLEADLSIREGNLETGTRWLEDIERNGITPPTYYERDLLFRARGRLALARGRFAEAQRVAASWIQQALHEGRQAAACRGRLLHALSLHRVDEIDRAAAEFGAALEWARSEFALAPFLEFREEVADLLRALDERGQPGLAADDFLQRLRQKVAVGTELRRLFTHLTRREQEILQLLRDDISNKHIARVSHITEDAVKFHLKNIYRKLGVHSRAEALRVLEDSRRS